MPVFFICQASVLIKYQMVFKYQNGSVFPSSVMSCGERKTRTPLIIHTWVLYDDTTTGSYGCSLNLHLGKWGKPDCVHDIYQPATLQHKWWLGKVIRSKERCVSTKLDTVIQVNRFQRSEIWTIIDIYLFLSFLTRQHSPTYLNKFHKTCLPDPKRILQVINFLDKFLFWWAIHYLPPDSRVSAGKVACSSLQLNARGFKNMRAN